MTMDNYHEPIRHLEYLRQSLSQDKKPIGFLISAGCPLSIQMPEGEWPLIPDVENLTKAINISLKDNDKYKVLLTELQKSKKDINNIEDILSFLRGLQQVAIGGDVRGLSEKNLLDLNIEICKEIVKRINVELPNETTPYHDIAKWVSSIDREIPIEIFTTNYDLLIESALESLEIPYFDGFVGARKSFFDLRAVENNLIPIHWTRLWKIHGSINWYQDELSDSKQIYRSSQVKVDGCNLIYPSHLKYEESRKMPYLALIDQLNSFIRQKSSILILSGYSFNDGHLNDTIINALKANPSGMVLALMFGSYYIEDEVERYPNAYKLAKKRHNLNLWTFDKAIIGTNLGDWKKNMQLSDNEDSLKFIEDIPSDAPINAGNSLIKLGDFAVFTNFLKILIGKKVENKDDK